MGIAVGSDERTPLTDFVIKELKRRGHEVELFDPLKSEPLSWVEVGEQVALSVSKGQCQEGILFALMPRWQKGRGNGTMPIFW